MDEVFGVFTFNDILFAAVTAYVITYVIKKLFGSENFSGISSDIQIHYDAQNIKNVLRNCYALFPTDIVPFRGDTFKRGMKVQILTAKNRVIKGEIVGLNKDNMLCLITSKYIVAQELSQIVNITPLSDDSIGG